MSHTRGQVFFEETRMLERPYKLGDDPRPLQLAFARLFDEAAQTIYRAGSDLDEVLVERILIVRNNSGAQYEIPADFLADADLLKNSVLQNLAESAPSAEAQVGDIVAVKLIARQDQLPQRAADFSPRGHSPP